MNVNEQIELITRGCDEIISIDLLKEKLSKKKKLTIKAGFDPTAPDIHLGHTVLLRKLKHFQQLGHNVNFLIGDFTAMIGDPTGKNSARKRLSREDVLKNAQTYKTQIFKILDPKKTNVIFNSKWLMPMNFGDVLELTSKYTVARLLERDDFSKRFKNNKPITLLEMMYPLIQGYDSVAMEADVEIGGTDQKFNLLVGRDLQKEYGKEQQVIMTMPILEGLDGVEKMSKSLNNYIGIDDTPFDKFGKIMSVNDNIMFRYFELLTDIPINEINKFKQEISTGENPRNIKIKLAKNIIEQYHGSNEALKCEEQFLKVFSKKGIPDNIPEIKSNNTPIINLIFSSGDFKSKSEIRRIIQSGGVSIINKDKIKTIDYIIKEKNIIIKVGKRKFYKII